MLLPTVLYISNELADADELNRSLTRRFQDAIEIICVGYTCPICHPKQSNFPVVDKSCDFSCSTVSN